MSAASSRLALAAVAAALGAAPASAAIYTWVDAKGNLNVSNLSPPEGVRVTSMVPDAPAPKHDASAANESAQVRALNERVRQLEDELLSASRPSAAALPPPPAAAPSIVQHVTVVMPPPADPVPAVEPAGWGCPPSWYGCSPGWGFYPSAVIVQGAPPWRHRGPGRPPVVPQPVDGVASWAMIRPLIR